MNARVLLRLLLLLALAVSGYLVLRGLVGGEDETAPPPSGPAHAERLAPPVAASLEPAARKEILSAARVLLEGGGSPATDRPLLADRAPAGDRLVAVSLSRPAAPAWVTWGRGPDLEAALTQAVTDLARRTNPAARSAGRLKVDVLVRLDPERTFDEQGQAGLELGLDGLWLSEAGLWLLPEEISSRRLVLPDGDLQSGRLRRYLADASSASAGRALADPEVNPGRAGMPYATARFQSLAEGDGGRAIELYRGNALVPEVSPEALLAAARAGGEYLLRHQRADGSFGYSYEPWDDDYARADNLLRQAGTCYALFELYAATGDRRFLEAGERGVGWLRTFQRGPRPEDAARGADFDAVVSPGEEAKLGGAALLMLAMLERIEATGDRSTLPEVRRLGRFLLFQQDGDGHFRSKYFYGKPDPVPFESVYYPGEAILALTRLHALDGNGPWLAAARKAADWLILVRDRGKAVAALPHDHWLLIGLNELHPPAPEAHYVEHARRVGEAILGAERRQSLHPDWIGSFYDPPRSTPAATRSEGLVALHHLASRNGLDPAPYREALLRMAAFERRCQITPESALYLLRPDRALGGFRRGLTDWEVRIDYVQHNLSAFLGLRGILLAGRS